MKSRNFIKNSIFALLPTALAMGVLFGTAKPYAEGAEAYNKASLPTTIDLKDNTDSEIRNYYSALNSKIDSEKSGTNLLKNLKGILKNGQQYYSYDTGKSDIWDMYEIIDRDWNKSPASSISGYNSETNKITNFNYGSGDDPYVHALYVDRSVENQMHARANHQQTLWGINQEHIWAKSQGFEANGAGGARGDVMHLWAADGKTNNLHSNFSFGYVDKTQGYSTPSGIPYAQKNYLGKSKTLGGSISVFEPQDSDKGDIARALMYMAARYNNYDGDTSIDQNNPSLRLVDSLCNKSSYTSNSSTPGEMGIISDLLEWNKLDPVDEFERHRNNLCFNNYTKNRNPFIDFPQWADIIWGNKSGTANPQTDPINGGSSGEATLTGISVTTKPTKLIYTAGESFSTQGMVVTGSYTDGKSKEISNSEYTFSPSGALTTSNNLITINCGDFSTSFDIAVIPSGGAETETITSYTFTTKSWSDSTDSWTSGKDGNAYIANQGVQVTTSASGANATSNTSFSGVKKIVVHYCTNSSMGAGSINLTVGGTPITTLDPVTTSGGTTLRMLEYTSMSGLSGNVNISVTCTTNSIYIDSVDIYSYSSSPAPITNVTEITLNPSSLTMEIGEKIFISKTIVPNNATIKLVSWSSSDTTVATVDDNGLVSAVSNGNVTITCSAMDESGVSSPCNVVVKEACSITSLTLSGTYKTSYYTGDSFSNDGMIVTAMYSDSSSANVTDEVEFDGFDSSTVGNKTITVSYSFGGSTATTTYTITVSEAESLSYSKVSGKFLGGEYVIGYPNPDGGYYVMKASISSNRFGYEILSGTNSVSTSDSSLIWTISKVGECYTIYNCGTGKYAGGTGTKNQGALFDSDSNNKTKWYLERNSSSDTYVFVNKHNSELSTPVNAHLQSNGTYGFACYSATNIKYLTMFRLNDTSFVKAKDSKQIEDGSRITFSCNYNSSTYAMGEYDSSSYCLKGKTTPLYKDGLFYTTNSELLSFDVIASNGHFAIRNGLGYIKNATSNYLSFTESIDSNKCLFDVVIVNGKVAIQCVDTGKYLRFNYNSGNPMFRFYNASGYEWCDIFVDRNSGEGAAWAKEFLDSTQSCNITDWDSFETLFNDLATNTQITIKNEIANPSVDASLVAQAMARYDYIVGDSRYDVNPFISDRNIVLSRGNITSVLTELADMPTMLIVLFLLAGLTTVSCYLHIRYKRREGING